MFVGLGVIKEVYEDPNKIGDTIAVDIVVANILVATAFNSMSNKLSVYHVGSSDRNPLTWGDVKQITTHFWNTNISPSKLSKSHLVYSPNYVKVKLS